jgi:hypothetical protein
MLVQSHDRFDDLGAFDPLSGDLDEFKRSRIADDARLKESLRGHFAVLGDTVAVLYRDDDALWLRLGDRARDLSSGRSSAKWERIGRRARLSLLDGAEEVASVEYVPGPTGGPSLADDVTPFASCEDWDFGLFVRNVVSDEGRFRRIYTDHE